LTHDREQQNDRAGPSDEFRGHAKLPLHQQTTCRVKHDMNERRARTAQRLGMNSAS
jgi:hypothetical protein